MKAKKKLGSIVVASTTLFLFLILVLSTASASTVQNSSSNGTLLVVNFSSNVTIGNTPLSVQFTDLSENVTSWNWSFGDGSGSVEQNPIHTYSTAGNYTVALTANNSAGSNNVTKYNYIIVVKPNDAIIEGHAPLSVRFTDLSEGATEWYWNFGDGANSTEQNPKHTYTEPGQYTVTLTANNIAGSNVITKNSYIIITSSLEAPVADFSVSTTSGKTPLNISFMDKSKGSPDSWNWNFGDGANSTEQNPEHTYSTAGNYTVTLAANNSAGSSAVTKFGYIIVASSLKAPVADFSASKISGLELPYWFTPDPYGVIRDKSGNNTEKFLPTELTGEINDGSSTPYNMEKDLISSETFNFGLDQYSINLKNPLKLVLLKIVYANHDNSQKDMKLEINAGGPEWIVVAANMDSYNDFSECDQNLAPFNITRYVNTTGKLNNLTVRFSSIGNAASNNISGWIDFVGIHVE